MAFKVGKTQEKPKQPRGGRVPLTYYRTGRPKDQPSPFTRRTAKKGRTRKYIIRSLDVILVILLLGGLVYSLLVKPVPAVHVSSTTYHSASEYQTAAAKYFGSLKNRNKVTFDEQGVMLALEKQFPEISGVDIELPLFSETAIVNIDIAQPSFFLDSAGQNYIIDAQGVATGVALAQPQIKNLTTLDDNSGFKTRLGERVLSAQSVNFINTLLVQAAHANVPIKRMVLPPQDQELDLYTADRAYFVKFYLGGDALLQSGQFLAARHNFDQSAKQPAQYLDVRVPGKIFYK